MIRVCPERDAECPHGMDCPYAVDRYTCNEDKAGTASPDHAELRRELESALDCEIYLIGHGPIEMTSAAILALLDENERLRDDKAELIEGFDNMQQEALEGLLRQAALRSRVSELEGALKKIINYEPEKVTGVIPDDWSEQIKNCPECQRYKGHPIQNGICDTHRKPLYERDRQEEHLYRTQHIQMVYIARAALRRAGEAADRGGEDG